MDEESEKPARDANGRLLPGNTANPSGENGLKGLPDLLHRQEYFETRYTVQDLKELMQDKERFGKLSITDAQIVTRLAATIVGGKERGRELERYYNRKYGTPKQTTEIQGVNGKDLIPDRAAESTRTVEAIVAGLAAAKRGSVDQAD